LVRLIKLDKKLDKWGINDGKVGTSIKFAGNLAFLIVFLIFLPSVFVVLNINSVTTILNNLAITFAAFIPNIIAAVIILFVGFLIAGLVEQIVAVLLKKTKIDNLAKKVDSHNNIRISEIIAKIISVFIVLVTVVQSVIVLGIQAVSVPALQIVNSVFGAVPSFLLAVIILFVGIILAKLVAVLLANLLLAVGFDRIIEKALSKTLKFSPAKVFVAILRVIIILFCLAQAVEILDFAILTNIMVALIGYLPLAAKALLIAIIAFIGAEIAEKLISKAMPEAKLLMSGLKTGIYVLAIFMIFTQLDIAKEIVVPAFIILFVAVGIAFAISFGLGGQEFAKKTLAKKCRKADNKDSEKKD